MQLTLLGSGPLVFDAPFGTGADRHTHVRAASALVRLGDAWLVAQDDSTFAAVWRGGSITPLRLFPEGGADTFGTARGNKADKPDLEWGAVVDLQGSAAILGGSGSTPRRTRVAVVREGVGVSVHDLAPLYAALRERTGLGPDELNLEGACARPGALRLFQRGNAGAGGYVDVPLESLRAALGGLPVRSAELGPWHPVAIGALGGVPLGFSAAESIPGGEVLFAASAEASPSTYDDGAVAGSVLGILGETGTIVDLAPVPGVPPPKVEGLAVEEIDDRGLTVLVVTDDDAPDVPSRWLRLRLTR